MSGVDYSLGSGAEHFVLPHNKAVLVLINHTDGGEHPIHLHGYRVWLVATSAYPEAEVIENLVNMFSSL